MKHINFGSRWLIVAAVCIICASVIAGAVVIGMWHSPMSSEKVIVNDPETTTEVAVFSAPTHMYTQTTEAYAPLYGVNHWFDTGTPIDKWTTGEHYWFDFDAQPTDQARADLAQGGATPNGWVWIMEIHKDGVKASDVTAEFRQDLKFADMRTAVVWNDSQPDRLVGMLNPAPDHMLVLTAPLYTYAEGFTHTQASGVIQFNVAGDYEVMCYIVTMDSTGVDYPGVAPHLDGLLKESPDSWTVTV